MTLVFTRYLYNVDEVVLTFLECLLKQKDVQECYYWIYEYYKTGYSVECWNLLWKIYCDFYMLKNPKMERKMKLKQKLWNKNNDISSILWVVKNLFRLDKCHTIFMLYSFGWLCS